MGLAEKQYWIHVLVDGTRLLMLIVTSNLSPVHLT